MCCVPTPDPCLAKRRRNEANRDDYDEPRTKKSNAGGWQGYNEEAGYEEDYDQNDDYENNNEYDNNGHYEEPEPEPEPPKRKKSKSKKKKGDQIDDDEFNFEVPQSNDGRVEYRERTLRDGRRQVDEITIHPDGSKTVTTQTYDS